MNFFSFVCTFSIVLNSSTNLLLTSSVRLTIAEISVKRHLLVELLNCSDENVIVLQFQTFLYNLILSTILYFNCRFILLSRIEIRRFNYLVYLLNSCFIHLQSASLVKCDNSLYYFLSFLLVSLFWREPFVFTRGGSRGRGA